MMVNHRLAADGKERLWHIHGQGAKTCALARATYHDNRLHWRNRH